jgi:hypothetical protein
MHYVRPTNENNFHSSHFSIVKNVRRKMGHNVSVNWPSHCIIRAKHSVFGLAVSGWLWQSMKAIRFLSHGDQMNLWKSRPKWSPNHFLLWKSRPKCSPNLFLSKLMHKLNRWKRGPHIGGTFVVFKKLPKVNNHPMGKNSHNLVTLFSVESQYICRYIDAIQKYRLPYILPIILRKRFLNYTT